MFPLQQALVCFLIRELRSRMPHSVAKKRKKNIVLWKVLMEGLRHLIDS